MPRYNKNGRPRSTSKIVGYEKAFQKTVDKVEVYMVKEVQDTMNENDDVHSVQIHKIKFHEKYVPNVKFVGRQRRSAIILLNNASSLLSEA